MKKLFLIPFLLLFVLSVVSAETFFYDNFNSYDDGLVEAVSSFWKSEIPTGFNFGHINSTYQSMFPFTSSIMRISTLNDAVNEVATSSFSPKKTGVINVWAKIGFNGLNGNWYIGVGEKNPVNDYSVSSYLANIKVSTSTSNRVVSGVGFSDTFTKDIFETFPDCYNNGCWVRMKINFDDDELNFYMYDVDKENVATHQTTYNFSAFFINSSYDVDRLSVRFQGQLGSGTYRYGGLDEIYIMSGNSLPVVSNVLINPSGFDEDTTIECSYTFVDDDLDIDNSNIKWFVDDVEQTFYEDNIYLNSAVFNDGDSVKCLVIANDGIDDGNTNSYTCVVGGLCSSVQTEVVLSGELVDFDATGIDIRSLDYFEGDVGISNYLVFVGDDGSNSYIGVANLFTPSSFGTIQTKNTGTQNYYGVDTTAYTIWTASNERIERFSNIISSTSLLQASPKNFNSTGEIYLDIVAIDDFNAVACYYEAQIGGDVEGLISFYYNSTSGVISNLDAVVGLEKCRSLVYYADEQIVYADAGVNGTAIIDVSDLNNMSLLGYENTRTSYSYVDRGDTIDVFNDKLFTDSSFTNAFEYDLTNYTEFEVVSGFCNIAGGFIYALDMIDENFMVLSNVNDNDIYYCDYINSDAQLVYSNPTGSNIGRDIVAFSDGGFSYVYTSTEDTLQILRLSSFDESVNQLPIFISATPDTEFIDNFNPIATNVSPVGLESPDVYVYPINCLNPSLNDCSFDNEGDNILFAVDKDLDGDLDTSWSSVENVFVNYAVEGIYTLRIYITDDIHPFNLQTYRDFTINVSGESVPLEEGEDTLKFRVRNSITDAFVSGVEVRGWFEGNQSNSSLFGYTNSAGELTAVVEEGVWLVEFSKNDFITQTNYYSTTALTYQVELEPVSDADKRVLQLIVKNDEGELLPYIFVEAFYPITQTFDFKTTDVSGSVVFSGFPEDNIVLTFSKQYYNTLELQLSVLLGSSIVREVVMTNTSISKIGECQDFISDVWLCGVDDIPCTIDEECVSGMCSVDGTCSSFNYNICDENGMERNNRCFFKYTTLGVMKGITNSILDYFLYVLAFVVILVGVVIVWSMNRTNRK